MTTSDLSNTIFPDTCYDVAGQACYDCEAVIWRHEHPNSWMNKSGGTFFDHISGIETIYQDYAQVSFISKWSSPFDLACLWRYYTKSFKDFITWHKDGAERMWYKDVKRLTRLNIGGIEEDLLREVFAHRAGRIFLLVLLLSVVGLFAVTPLFSRPVIIMGWISLPFAAGILFLLIWLCAYLIYFLKYWPFRWFRCLTGDMMRQWSSFRPNRWGLEKVS